MIFINTVCLFSVLVFCLDFRKHIKLTTDVLLFRVKSGFDSENLMWLEQLFRQTVGDEMEIKRDDFNKILITKNVS